MRVGGLLPGRAAGLLLAFALLPACAVMQPAPETPIGGGNRDAFIERQTGLAGLERWRVKARMASGVIGWSGQVDWHQQPDHLLLTVAGPLGVGGIRAEGDLAQVTVETSDGETYRGDPDVLFNALVGWPFPVKGMRYWAIGMPMPAVRAHTEIDGEGLLRVMQQSGWRVEYLEYRESQGFMLPRKMRLDNGEISVRVVIDKWLELSV